MVMRASVSPKWRIERRPDVNPELHNRKQDIIHIFQSIIGVIQKVTSRMKVQYLGICTTPSSDLFVVYLPTLFQELKDYIHQMEGW
jgi:hypothetical protein